MNTKLKHLLWIGILCFPFLLQAQTNHRSESNMLSVHIGPSWYMDNPVGLTDYGSQYLNSLEKGGVNWNMEYTYLFMHTLFTPGIGILYQGSRHSAQLPESSDKLLSHYIAPQVSLYYRPGRFNINFVMGMGALIYKNKSTVYDKPRQVKLSKLAINFGLGGEYLITKHWGASARLDFMGAFPKAYTVKYHGKEWEVYPHYPLPVSDVLSLLTFSAGINYHF